MGISGHEQSSPLLSIVIRVVGGSRVLRRCLSSLAPQVAGNPMEVLVPCTSGDSWVSELAGLYPWATFLQTEEGILGMESAAVAHIRYDRLTSVGLGAAHGEVVAILEDCCIPASDWCAQLLRAHRAPHAAIGGAVEYAGKGLLSWSIYVLDFGRYQLPIPEGPADYLTDVNISYKRAALDAIKDLWAERYNEVTVNWALAKRGATLWRTPLIVVNQDRGRISFPEAMRERFDWGGIFGAARSRELSRMARLSYVVLSPAIPLVLLGRVSKKVFLNRRDRLQFVLSLPLMAIMASVWCCGEVAGSIFQGRVSPSRAASSSPDVIEMLEVPE